METYLGLDLGGTKLLIGEMDSRGNILRYKKYDSGYFNQQAALEIIKSSLDDYIRTVGWYDQKPVAMGVGLIGRVDPNEGVWLQIDPSRTQRIELAKELSDIYGMPCHIDNDVKSATRAERVWGFGQISKKLHIRKCRYRHCRGYGDKWETNPWQPFQCRRSGTRACRCEHRH